MKLSRVDLITIVGLLIVCGAAWTAGISIQFLATASRATGIVVDMAQTKEGLWYPVIEFVTADGKAMKVQPESASSAPGYTKGQSIEILYKHDDPQNWRLKSFSDLWLISIIIGVIGIILVVAGVGFHLLDANFMSGRGDKVLELLGAAILGLIGVVMLWGAWYVGSDTRKFLKDAVPEGGKIIELRRNESKDSNGKVTLSYYPAIEFKTEEGESITFRSNVGVDEIKNPVGSEIKILYSRSNPKIARIDSAEERWGSSLLLAIMGLASVIGALLIYFLLYREVKVDGPLFLRRSFFVSDDLALGSRMVARQGQYVSDQTWGARDRHRHRVEPCAAH